MSCIISYRSGFGAAGFGLTQTQVQALGLNHLHSSNPDLFAPFCSSLHQSFLSDPLPAPLARFKFPLAALK